MTIFDFVRNKVDILEIANTYINLKKIGTYFKGSCPFHKEADASFTISPAKQIFFCFGCKKGGDAIGFIAEIEKISQLEAVTYLAEKFKINIPHDLSSNKENIVQQDKNIYLMAHQVISQWCHAELFDTPSALEYLKVRGVANSVIKDFNIGFFPSLKNRKNALLKTLLNNSILQENLLEIGIFVKNQSHEITSPFEDRILFPIHDNLSRCVGFGGRIFLPNDTRPKYYNSKEAELFLKRKLLFGLDQAKFEASKQKSIFMVEGYLDTVMMHQYGYKNCVATLGTSCSKDHLLLVERFANTLYVMYDNDTAGVSAVLKLAEMSLETNIEVKVVELNPKLDPAAQLQLDSQVLKDKISQAKDILSFFITTLSNDFFSLSNAQKLTSLDKMLPIIGNITNPIKKFLLLQKISALTGINLKILNSEIHPKKNLIKPIKDNSTQQAVSHKMKPEDILFFYELINRQQNIYGQIISKDMYDIFPNRIIHYLKETDDLRSTQNPTTVLVALMDKASDTEKQWLQEGLIQLELTKDTLYIEPLIDKVFLKYTKESLSTCNRSMDLSKDSIDRTNINSLLFKIQTISNHIKQRKSNGN